MTTPFAGMDMQLAEFNDRLAAKNAEIDALLERATIAESERDSALARVKALEARAEAAEKLLEVPGRKMVYVVGQWRDDKESKAWLEQYAAWRQARENSALLDKG
jgi:hypothetical protein